MKKLLLIFGILALALGACSSRASETTQAPGPAAGGTQPPAAAGERTLRVMTHDSFAISEPVVQAFQQENNVKVQFIKSGDAGTALNKAILSKGNPLADVFYGVDNTFLSRALAEDIFDPYASPALAEIPAAFQLDPQNRALPVDYGDVCLNYDIAYFKDKNLPPPESLEDLAKPEYKSLLVVENPATSSPGLAFMLATIGHYGADGWLDYWKSLTANDVQVVNDWETAYNSEFSAHGGARPIVVSYASSPPAEVIFAAAPVSEAPTAAVTGNGSCFRQVEFAGILKGGQNRDLAEKWVDFMLSTRFQEDMPLQMFVFPVDPAAKLPKEFEQYTVIPSETAQVSPDDIAANRETWLQAWTEAVLR